MPEFILLNFDQLTCNTAAEADGAEPYLWPALITVSNAFEVQARGINPMKARLVLADGMSSGSVNIPSDVSGISIQSNLNDVRAAIGLVVLMEADDIPEHAMLKAYEAFIREIPNALTPLRLLGLSSTNEEDRVVIKQEIREQLSKAAQAAAENDLSFFEKIIFAASGNADDTIGFDFVMVKRPDSSDSLNIPERTITFKFSSPGPDDQAGDDFILTGRISTILFPPPGGACAAEREALTQAKDELENINGEIENQQLELQHASPTQKPRIVMEIHRLEAEVPAAEHAVEQAQTALNLCIQSTQLAPV
jgi:hypothetical protein